MVITADILLADRCLKSGAVVIGNNGKPFTTDPGAGTKVKRGASVDIYLKR